MLKLISVFMLDVDYIKTINDTYGHANGDKALQDLVGILREKLRYIIGRIGGEEFAVVNNVTIGQLLHKVDMPLYEAKETSRNCIVILNPLVCSDNMVMYKLDIYEMFVYE